MHVKLSTTRVSLLLLLVITTVVCARLLQTSTATTSVRVSITTAKRMDEDAAEWVETPPTADHAALLARALGDANNYLTTVHRPICLISVFALKVQHADTRRTNYLFQVNGCVVETPVSGGFCRDAGCRLLPFEVELHAEHASSSSSLGQANSKLVVVAIRYLD